MFNSIDVPNAFIWFSPEMNPAPHCIVMVRYKDDNDVIRESAAVKEHGKWIPQRVNMLAWRYFQKSDFSRR
jgi:hypothetical protein